MINVWFAMVLLVVKKFHVCFRLKDLKIMIGLLKTLGDSQHICMCLEIGDKEGKENRKLHQDLLWFSSCVIHLIYYKNLCCCSFLILDSDNTVSVNKICVK